jgi:hypothetical protein
MGYFKLEATPVRVAVLNACRRVWSQRQGRETVTFDIAARSIGRRQADEGLRCRVQEAALLWPGTSSSLQALHIHTSEEVFYALVNGVLLARRENLATNAVV